MSTLEVTITASLEQFVMELLVVLRQIWNCGSGTINNGARALFSTWLLTFQNIDTITLASRNHFLPLSY